MHLGLICPVVSGHLNPMTTLGRELQSRGHRVSLIAFPDGREKAAAFQHQLQAFSGVRRGADLALAALTTRRPVFREESLSP